MTSSQTLGVDFTQRRPDSVMRTTRICKPSISSARIVIRSVLSNTRRFYFIRFTNSPGVDFTACTRVCPSSIFVTRASSSSKPLALFGENSRCLTNYETTRRVEFARETRAAPFDNVQKFRRAEGDPSLLVLVGYLSWFLDSLAV